MDQRTLDRFARLLGGATTRRRGLAAALGAAIGLPFLADDADAKQRRRGGTDKETKKGRNKGKPGAEGPCGNGSRKDNICKKDKECCTGICRKGLKNKDGQGRCRCLRRGKSCTEDKNCCNTLTCVNGVCGGGSPIPTSDPCVEGVDTCADPNASCTTYDAETPAGTYCLLPYRDSTCTKNADCACNSCFDGTCITCGCGGCPETAICASPTVCASGCTHSTVQGAVNAAINDEIITIGPGTYVEDVSITGKNLTLFGCPAGGDVILTNATATRAIIVTDESSLTINDLIIRGDSDTNAGSGGRGGGVETAGGNVCIGARTVIENSYAAEGGGLRVGGNTNDNQTLLITDGVVIQNNTADSYGGGVYNYSGVTTIEGHAKITGNTGTKGGGVAIYYSGKATFGGNVEITDNIATESNGGVGGGIHFYGGGHSGTVVVGAIGGKVLIARNKALGSKAQGGGVAIQYSGIAEEFYFESNVVISDNISDSYGGGIYNEDGKMTVRGNVKITGNQCNGTGSDTDGGGIYGTGTLTLQDNVEISSNAALRDGGGIWHDDGPVDISGAVTIRNNTAGDEGGGIFMNTDSSVTIAGTSSITGNTAASGGGIWSNQSGQTVTGGAAVTGNTPTNCDGSGLTC
jgi:predicted outer membrane repeat protein